MFNHRCLPDLSPNTVYTTKSCKSYAEEWTNSNNRISSISYRWKGPFHNLLPIFNDYFITNCTLASFVLLKLVIVLLVLFWWFLINNTTKRLRNKKT
jgi:hypothetical protein